MLTQTVLFHGMIPDDAPGHPRVRDASRRQMKLHSIKTFFATFASHILTSEDGRVSLYACRFECYDMTCIIATFQARIAARGTFHNTLGDVAAANLLAVSRGSLVRDQRELSVALAQS
jgi:hypothetical protein